MSNNYHDTSGHLAKPFWAPLVTYHEYYEISTLDVWISVAVL